MKRRIAVSWLVITGLMGPGAGDLAGQLTDDNRSELVLSLLPAEARGQATVVFRDGAGDRVYRQGDGAFLCVSDTSPSDRISMVCHHRILEDRLRYERELRARTGLSGAAFRERLCEEVTGSHLDVPPGAMEILSSLQRGEDGDYADAMTVYHLLWTPGENATTIGVTDEDPGEGRPFLHQSGTCGAHVMWSEVRPVRGVKP